MSKRKQDDIIDDDGNALAPPEPGSPVANIIYLLEYGRKRGFQIGPIVRVDGTAMQVRDLRQAAATAKEQRPAPDLALDPDMALLLGPDS